MIRLGRRTPRTTRNTMKRDTGTPTTPETKSVLDHDRHFQEVVEGELEEVQYYEGRISK